jgi:hypothetical protein
MQGRAEAYSLVFDSRRLSAPGAFSQDNGVIFLGKRAAISYILGRVWKIQ